MQDLLTRLLLAGGGGFSPSALFGGGAVQGAWYDPSDFGTTGTGGVGTLYQDSAGTTPVTAVEQPVGLMLDKSKGLVLGSELATNGGFDTDTAWTKGVGCTITGGRLIFTSVANNVFTSQSMSGLAGETYAEITIVVASVTAGQLNVQLDGGAGSAIRISIPGTYTYRLFKTLPNNNAVYILAVGTTTAEIESISVKKIAGNHAYQTTSASRPTLRARYNLLTYSEEFDNAVWVKAAGVSVSANTTVAPDGTLTADTISATSNEVTQNVTTISGATYRHSVYVAKTTSATIYPMMAFNGSGTSGQVILNTNTGVAANRAGSFATNISVFDVGNYWRLTFDYVPDTTASTIKIYAAASSNGTSYSSGLSASHVFWGAQLTIPAVFPSNTYQRVGASTDYATGAAFPPYLFFDGLDDSMLTNSVDFSATDKMTVFAGVTKLSDSTSTSFGVLAELSTDTGTQNGSFALIPNGAASFNFKLDFVSRGTAKVDVVSNDNAYSAPLTAVLTGLANISGDSAILRVNGVQAATSATDQGTGNYGNYPLYIGRRNNASLPFNGNLYSLIVQGATPTSSQLVSTEQWVAAKTPLGSV